MRRLGKKEIRIQLIITLLIAISVPVTVYLALQRQDLRTKAGPGLADLSISPALVTKSAGVSDTIDVFINPGGEQVSGIELVIDYDQNLLDVTDITPGQFFTDEAPTVGQPLEIIKNISNGRIYYALAFPLGSNYFSIAAASTATIHYTTLASGSANLNFVVSGSPATTISDVNALNVLGNTFLGTITVSQGPRLYFLDPTPANPQKVGTNFDIMVYTDTAGQDIDGVDARIRFDATALQVVDVVQGISGEFTSFPALDYDNTSGTVSISANIGSAGTTTAANGANLHVGTITFNPTAQSAGTLVTFNYAPGERNDSNIVLSGTLQDQDPTDILAAVTNTNIVIEAPQQFGPTSTPTPTPTPSPVPTIPGATATLTPSPTLTPTPTNTPTPTPPPASTLMVRLRFQGRIRTGIDRTRQVAVRIKSKIGQVVLDATFEAGSNGEFPISIQQGDYLVLVKAPGYLAKRFGSLLSPVGVTQGQTELDLTSNPLIGGDFNEDGIINEVDYTLNFLPSFQTSNSVVDLDGSGEVNNLDFGVMRSNWNLVDDVI